MRVRDLMTAPVFAVGETDSLKVADEVMEWKHIRHLPVIDDDGHLVGLITHRDLIRACVSSVAQISRQEQEAILSGIPVKEIMNPNVVTTEPDSKARDAARLMLDRKIGCLPVVEGSKLVGILTEADFVRSFLEILE